MELRAVLGDAPGATVGAQTEGQLRVTDTIIEIFGRTPMRNVLVVALLLTSLACVTEPERSQHRDMALQFMAPDGTWADSSFTGHAFVCLQLETDSSVTEDCFGFYPRAKGTALVGGPGVVDKEFDFSKSPPTRFGNVQVSVRTRVTMEQRQKALAFIRGFDKDFSLTSRNCVLFANGLARLVGLTTPKSSSFPTPVEYLRELRQVNPGK